MFALQSACDTSDACVEPHPLWEYPCLALGKPTRVMAFDLNEPMPSHHLTVDQEFEIEEQHGGLNGNIYISNISPDVKIVGLFINLIEI